MLQDLVPLSCPYCGESIEVLVDLSAGPQEYIEDCTVCCRPIEVRVNVDAEGAYEVHLYRGDA